MFELLDVVKVDQFVVKSDDVNLVAQTLNREFVARVAGERVVTRGDRWVIGCCGEHGDADAHAGCRFAHHECQLSGAHDADSGDVNFS